VLNSLLVIAGGRWKEEKGVHIFTNLSSSSLSCCIKACITELNFALVYAEEERRERGCHTFANYVLRLASLCVFAFLRPCVIVMFLRLVKTLKEHTRKLTSLMDPLPVIGYNPENKLISFHPIGCILFPLPLFSFSPLSSLFCLFLASRPLVIREQTVSTRSRANFVF
jgi:hypothetical protein